jgi:hypothetical protein
MAGMSGPASRGAPWAKLQVSYDRSPISGPSCTFIDDSWGGGRILFHASVGIHPGAMQPTLRRQMRFRCPDATPRRGCAASECNMYAAGPGWLSANLLDKKIRCRKSRAYLRRRFSTSPNGSPAFLFFSCCLSIRSRYRGADHSL